MNKENMKVAEKVFQEQYGASAIDLVEKTAEQVIKEKLDYYESQSEMGRAMAHATEVESYETFRRRTLSFFTGEFSSVIKTLNMVDEIPSTYRRETMRFFVGDFPAFDAGASVAIGRFLKVGLEWVQENPNAVSEKGRSEQLAEYILQGIKERSKARYFVELRKDSTEFLDFADKLRAYCGLVWGMYMVEEGTYTNDMPIADRIRNQEERGKAEAVKFLEESFKVMRDSQIKAEVVYDLYEVWTKVNGLETLGQRKLLSTIVELIPAVHVTSIGDSSYVRGLRIAV